jgi:hypothetical protein
MASASIAQAAESNLDPVAASVRQHGYRCDKAEKLAKDAARSGPDRLAWLLSCDAGSRQYRVNYIGHDHVVVEQLREQPRS